MRYAISFFLIIVLSSFYFLGMPSSKIHKTLHLSMGGEEESEAKRYQEFMMLRDPETNTIPANIRSKELEYLQHFGSKNQKTHNEDWVQRGPWNVGGRTRAIAMDITNENVILAGSVSGGIYRSTDQGVTWARTSNLSDRPGIVSLAQDTRAGKQNIWYALSGEASGTSASNGAAFYFGSGMYKSIDSGKSWASIASTAMSALDVYTSIFQLGWRVKISPKTNKDIIYVANLYGIQKSENGGSTWTIARGDFSNPITYYTDLDISSTGVVYATLSSDDAAHKGIYRTADDSTWANITPTQYINNYDRIVLDVNPNNENEVYFFVSMEDSIGNPGAVVTSNYKGTKEYVALLKYTYLSGDGTGVGGLWENLSANLPTTSGGPFDKINCQGSYDMLVKVQPITNNLYVGGTNLYVSTDHFTTPNHTLFIGGYKPNTYLPFFEIYPLHHPDQHDVIFSPSDTSLVISASDGGVRITHNIYGTPFVSWINANGGYFTSQYYTVAIDRATPNDPYLLGGFQDNGNFITNTYAIQHQWALPVNGDGAYSYIAPHRDWYVMSIQLGKMVKCSLDNAGNLLGFKRIDPIGPTENDYLFINPFEVDPNDNNLLYLAAGRRLYRQNSLASLPLDGHYDSISTGWTVFSDSTIATKITAVAVSKSPANIVYFGTNSKDIYKITNANVGNPSFQKITSSIMPNGGYLSSIAIDEKDANKVLVAFSNHKVSSLYYTIDGGVTWGKVGGTLEIKDSVGTPPSVSEVAIAYGPNGSKKYFAGTSIGLFSADTMLSGNSLLSQTHWVREGVNQIGAAVVKDIAWRESDGYVVVGTHGSGAFASYFNSPVGIAQVKNTSLLKVYPNPSSDIVHIDLPSDRHGLCNLTVYNILGAKLENKIIDQNAQIEDIQINSWTSGMYLVRLEYNNHIFVGYFNKK